MSNETDLDWLARTEHNWPKDAIYVSRHENAVEWHYVELAFKGRGNFTKDQWLARRAELQNKPVFSDHPDAKCLFQHESGRWFKNIESSDMGVDGIGWRNNQLSRRVDYGWVVICQGEVIGDWRHTLEKRPEEFKPSIEEANRLAKEFKPFTSIEDSQEKEMKQDNGWFERGELPPVGVECEILWNDGEWNKTKILSHLHIDCVNVCPVFTTEWDDVSYVDCMPHYKSFRPIRTERELAIEDIKSILGMGGSFVDSAAAKLYDAGYRKESM